jgi:hypothetical protein
VIARLCGLALLLLCACSLELLRIASAGPRAEVPAGVDAANLKAPLGKGLPVLVRTAVYFADIDEIDENEGEFVATIDVRLRWEDPRLRFPASEAPRGFVDLRDEAALDRIAQIWTPAVVLGNVVGEPSEESRGLRLYPDGRVELLRRTHARFKTSFDFERFPFDRSERRVIEFPADSCSQACPAECTGKSALNTQSVCSVSLLPESTIAVKCPHDKNSGCGAVGRPHGYGVQRGR